jgi:hypothetical protein
VPLLAAPPERLAAALPLTESVTLREPVWQPEGVTEGHAEGEAPAAGEGVGLEALERGEGLTLAVWQPLSVGEPV